VKGALHHARGFAFVFKVFSRKQLENKLTGFVSNRPLWGRAIEDEIRTARFVLTGWLFSLESLADNTKRSVLR